MTEHDLRTLVRDHVHATEPAFTLRPAATIGRGRRVVVRRRLTRGIGAIAAVSVLVAGYATLQRDGGPGAEIDPATAAALEQYDAAEMPTLIDQHARAVLSDSVPDLGEAEFKAGDGQGNPLPERLYDKASSMSVEYGDPASHTWEVRLTHAKSEAEGDLRENCANDLADGSYLVCDIDTTHGQVTVTRVMAMVPMEDGTGAWAGVPRESLETGVLPAWMEKGKLDPDDLFFARYVEAVHSESFLTNAEETVRARTLEEAQAAWQVPVEDLRAIVTDPELVIPEPPIDERNCPWTLPESGVTCGVTPEEAQAE